MDQAKRSVSAIGCIGEAMIEISGQDWPAATLGVAGDTYNTAVYLRRALGASPISVSYVTALGDDAFSDRILQEMQRHGLATGAVERREGMVPGLYAISTDAAGERSFTYWRSTAAVRTLFKTPCRVTLDGLDDAMRELTRKS